ncbi:hypothetical protein JL722_2653 [Aureococcus anophagefferens]|nr:hypothetical protein JL722_2653 [Aureococcus anophagefferens]
MGGGDALFPASADDALGHPDHDYLRDDDGSCAVDLDAVNGLLAERLDAKRDRNFPRADELRDELMRTHGVRVWDRERTWSAQPKNSFRRREPRPLPEAHDYSRGGDLSAPVDETAVDALLLARMHAKMGRDFGRADALREELSRDHGVRVHDGTKTWIAARGREHGPRLIAKRSRLKLRRKFHEADGIRDALLAEHNVHIDDKKRTWSMQKRRLGTKAELVPALEDLD